MKKPTPQISPRHCTDCGQLIGSEHCECSTTDLAREIAIVESLADYAEQAFWEALASQLPQVTSGNLEPAAAARFSAACKVAAAAWIRANAKAVR